MNMSVTIDPQKVAVYIRWSTDDQSEGTTLKVQREACEAFLISQGWQFREDLLYIDDGYSGGTLDRPGLTALRKAAKHGKISCCVVYKLDRLSRSVLDTVTLILQEWEGQCYVKSTREPIDTTTPTGKMFFYMLASYAEWERSVIRERTMSGKTKRAQEGKNPGFTFPYGYRKDSTSNEWVIDEAEAAVVRRIFHEYIQGHSSTTIADRLLKEGVRTRPGNSFHPSYISRILRNRCYTGALVYGQTLNLSPSMRKREGRARLRFEQPRYAVEGAHAAIISLEEYEQAHAIAASRHQVTGRRALGARFLLSGIIRCQCGTTLGGHVNSRRGTYYRCSQNRRGVPNPCTAALIPSHLLDEAIISRVRSAFAPDHREIYVHEVTEAIRQQRAAEESALKTITESLKEVGRKRQRCDTDYGAGELPARMYASLVEGLEREEQEFLKTREAHQAALQELQSATAHAKQFDELSTKLDGWDYLDDEERKQVLRFAIGRCTAFRQPAAKAHTNTRAPVEIDLEVRRPTVPVASIAEINQLAAARIAEVFLVLVGSGGVPS